jgi:uncharacterized protein DUF6894
LIIYKGYCVATSDERLDLFPSEAVSQQQERWSYPPNKSDGVTMPRYYIDVRSTFGTDEDLDGTELPDLIAAHAEALEVGRKLRERWTEIPLEARHNIIVELVDEGFRTLLTLPVSELEDRIVLH